jgi:hypothetical protein
LSLEHFPDVTGNFWQSPFNQLAAATERRVVPRPSGGVRAPACEAGCELPLAPGRRCDQRGLDMPGNPSHRDIDRPCPAASAGPARRPPTPRRAYKPGPYLLLPASHRRAKTNASDGWSAPCRRSARAAIPARFAWRQGPRPNLSCPILQMSRVAAGVNVNVTSARPPLQVRP